MDYQKSLFVTSKEITYPSQTISSFNFELYKLLNCILNHSLENVKYYFTKKEQLIKNHAELLNSNFNKNDNYKITITVYFKDIYKKKYNLSYATEEDLLKHAKSFKSLRERLEEGKNIMYYQKNFLTFKSAQLSSTKSLRIEAFLDFFRPRNPEFFIYNQMVTVQLTKKYILFVTEYPLKTFVIKLEIT